MRKWTPPRSLEATACKTMGLSQNGEDSWKSNACWRGVLGVCRSRAATSNPLCQVQRGKAWNMAANASCNMGACKTDT
eukprot:7772915-Lingulodinium_polyedra.AAC.1